MNINEAIQIVFEHLQAGNLEQARNVCKKILKIQPNNADVYFDLGNIFQEKGQLDEAITYYQKAIELNPNFAGTHFNLGDVFQEKGQLDEAVIYYQKTIELAPNFAGTYNNLGNIFQEKGQLDEAITYYQKAIELNPRFAGTYNNLGDAFRRKKQTDEAITYYQKALQIDPNYAHAYYSLGIVLQENGQLDEAITCYRKVLQLNQNHVEAYNNLGNAFQEKGLLDEAITYYQKAIELNPNFAGVYYNFAVALQYRKQLDEAITYYQKAIELNPNFADAYWNISVILLLSGNFEKGWKEYEWRWKTKEFCQRSFSQPLWDGSDIKGRTILLHAEQGLGDTIQFIRYAPLVVQRGARVIVECQRELKSLLQNVEGISQIITCGKRLPEFDVHCPLLSLPLVFNTTPENIPANIPYITVDFMLVQKWQDKIYHDNSNFKIGLVWSGKPTYKNDRNRSCSLELFSPLAIINDITFYSLQKGEAAEQAKNPPEGMKLIDYTEQIHDFADTAAFIENLDLIISVDTAAAHLAGALGKSVWTLLPFVPDWRWLLTRDDSPWYPTMRLFRQPLPGDWKSVIAKLAEELQKIIIKS